MHPDALPPEGWLHPAVEVRSSPIDGEGLFATVPIDTGEVVSVAGGTVITNARLRELLAAREDDPSRPYVDAITLGEDLNLLLNAESPNRFGNHSCDPNTWWVDAVTLVARRPVRVDEEITNDYATSTGHPNWSMRCRCGSALCRGVVTGDDWRDTELQGRYGPHWIPALRRRIDNTPC